MNTTAEMIKNGKSMGNDAPEGKDKKYIGDYTIITRNFKIADAIAAYLLTTPKAKL